MALITGAGITAAMAVGVPAAASAATAAPMDLPAACSPGSTVYCTYTYTGIEQTFVVPAGVTTIDGTANGAAGGNDGALLGGAGGYGTEVMTVTPGETLYLEVGGPGLDASTTRGTAAQAGGFNGGGAGSAADTTSFAPASGGGASDIRTASGGADPTTTNLSSRLVVGGGGGGAANCGIGGQAGQNGSFTSGVGCPGGMFNGGGGGTTTIGGDGGGTPALDGVLGVGGAGGPSTPPASVAGVGGGGGGGGYYGGGGGGPTSGGGGGASYAPDGLTSVAPGPAEVVISYTAPPLSISIATHRNMTVDATGPAGAVVHYTAPAVTDQANPMDPPKAVCVPPSGSTFAIGTTTVTCTATDVADDNSPVSTTFTVHVVGAPGQLAALYWDVRGYGPALANTVLIAEHAVNTENPQRACLPLDAFIIEVATHIPPLPPIARAYLIAAAGQIRTVLGCSVSWLP